MDQRVSQLIQTVCFYSFERLENYRVGASLASAADERRAINRR